MSGFYRQNLKVHAVLADLSPDDRVAEIVAACLDLEPQPLRTAEYLLDVIVHMGWKMSRKDCNAIAGTLLQASNALRASGMN